MSLSKKTVQMRSYLIACVGLLVASLLTVVQMVPQMGKASQPFFAPSTTHAQSSQELWFVFVDSETNARVNPDLLSVDGQDYTSFVNNGEMIVPAEPRPHLVTVLKDGYFMMEEIFIEPTNGTKTEFRFLREDWVENPNAFEIAAGLGEMEGRIVGYLRDSATGAPLAGAIVSLDHQDRQTLTEADGFYSLDYRVAIKSTDATQVDMDTLRFTADGYVMQERLYVHLFGGVIMKYLINLDALDPQRLGGPYRQTVDERLTRGGVAAWADKSTPNAPPTHEGTPDDLGPFDPALRVEPVIDSINQTAGIRVRTIRVGLNCPQPPNPACRTGCTSVQVMNLEEYTRLSLPREWFTSWGANAHQAGAVAVRSYAGSFILNPASPRYDICSNTCCQAFGPPTHSATDAAIRLTQGLYVVTGPVIGGRPFRSEYSSENNNAPPCRRDGFTGPCLSDGVCACSQAGRIGPCATNGHGRGMCQYGSQRWGAGQPGSGGAKNRVWILEHYYTNNPGYSGQGVKLGHW